MISIVKTALHCLAKGAPPFVSPGNYLLPLGVLTASAATAVVMAHQFEIALRSVPGNTHLQGVKNIIFACRLSKFAVLMVVLCAIKYQIDSGIANGCLNPLARRVQ